MVYSSEQGLSRAVLKIQMKMCSKCAPHADDIPNILLPLLLRWNASCYLNLSGRIHVILSRAKKWNKAQMQQETSVELLLPILLYCYHCLWGLHTEPTGELVELYSFFFFRKSIFGGDLVLPLQTRIAL